MVARTRGASFKLAGNYYVTSDLGSMQRAERAARDVAKWLGFRSQGYYFLALEAEERAIFKRAAR